MKFKRIKTLTKAINKVLNVKDKGNPIYTNWDYWKTLDGTEIIIQ